MPREDMYNIPGKKVSKDTGPAGELRQSRGSGTVCPPLPGQRGRGASSTANPAATAADIGPGAATLCSLCSQPFGCSAAGHCNPSSNLISVGRGRPTTQPKGLNAPTDPPSLPPSAAARGMVYLWGNNSVSLDLRNHHDSQQRASGQW